MPKSSIPIRTTLATVIRGAREAGFPDTAILAWLTAELERNPPPDWPKAWRFAFDEDGRATLITSDGEISCDHIVMATTGPLGLRAAPDGFKTTTAPNKKDQNDDAIKLGRHNPQSAGNPQHLAEDAASTAKPDRKEENKTAIELAAQQLRKNPKLKRNELYDRLFGPEDKRAPLLKGKGWATTWTKSRFLQKVWKPARIRAGLNPLSPKGRRPDEQSGE